MSELTLPEACAALAAAVGTVTAPSVDFTINASPTPLKGGDRRPGDAWVIPPRVQPARFGGVCVAELQAVLVLGSDPARASELYAALAVPVVNAVTEAMGLAGVSCTPESLLAGESVTGPLYVLTVTGSTEVS